MYCINCGVELADTEKQCPLCHTTVFHPDLQRPETAPLYPASRSPRLPHRSKVLPASLTALMLLAAVIVLLCDLQLHGTITYAGIAIGGIAVAYTATALPSWFRAPNPVIFTPCTFAAVLLYLLYIDLYTGGSWFLRFAFPVVGGTGLIATAAVTLWRYLKKGRLFILGGTAIVLGGLMLLIEWLLHVTFAIRLIGWSLYPTIVLAFLGGVLIFLGICRPAREAMERKLFI